MRSSKSRSRGKSNRNRNNNTGNNVNRVFDSSGPEGRVRGTPQQIFEKYSQMGRDAELGNDRVAQENFQQHAEHYLRIVTVAQREADTRREQHERENRERQVERDRERQERQDRETANRQAAEARREENKQRYEAQQQTPEQDAQPEPRPSSHQDTPRDSLMGGDMVSQMQGGDPANAPQPDIIDIAAPNESAQLETPQTVETEAPVAKPKPKRAPRKPRAKKAPAAAPSEAKVDAISDSTPDTKADAAE